MGVVVSVDTNSRNSRTEIFHGVHPDEHLACIQYLITNGAPTDQEYNQTNITLARYALSRGLADDAAWCWLNQWLRLRLTY